jgi:hypothetical protein
MQDFEAADEYCLRHQSHDADGGQDNLFFSLLKLYMQSAATSGSLDSIPPNAYRLLNSRANQLDPVMVMQLLPDSIPVHLIAEFLRKVCSTDSERSGSAS